MARAGRF